MIISEKILDQLRRALGIVSPCRVYIQPAPLPAQPLKIAFLGYNAKHTHDSLVRLCSDNALQVKTTDWNRGRVVLFDGTEITTISHPDQFRGRRFDQVIIADDNRGRVSELYIYLTYSMHMALSGSKIPEEWQVQIYDLDAEVPQYGV